MESVSFKDLDEGIRSVVKLLNDNDIVTFESCEGGNGHAFNVPTVRFGGNRAEGYKAFALLLFNCYPVSELRRYWVVIDGELTGPEWEITFHQKAISRTK